MALINEHFLKLQKNYLFADIAKKVNAFKATHPKADVISLGIGDVTQPLCPAVIEAMHKAVDDMAHKDTFHGYGPEQGYLWLREAIVKNDFLPRGVHLDPDEIFVNDGAKSDTGNIGELVRWDNSMAVTDPIYPVYVDSNVMNGRSGYFENGHWSNVTYMPCTEDNNFVPVIPDHRVDMIYLCYPNNPTGMVITRDELRKWVNYAIHNDSIIFYDAASRLSSAMRTYPIRSMRSVAPARWPSNSIAIRKQPVSLECVAVTPLCPRSSPQPPWTATVCRSIPSGCAANPPSSTAPATYRSAPQRPSTHPRVSDKRKQPSTITWRTPASCMRR